MLHTNLATRPIYNERFVHLVLLLVALLVVAVTATNVNAIVDRSRRATEFDQTAAAAELRARDLEQQTTMAQRESGDADLENLAMAADEANRIIDQRLFSWTEFFNRIEANLPPGVMISSIRPSIERDGVVITLSVVGRSVEDLEAFMEQLEATGAFSELLSRQEEVTDDAMYRAVLVGRYDPTDAGVPEAAT